MKLCSQHIAGHCKSLKVKLPSSETTDGQTQESKRKLRYFDAYWINTASKNWHSRHPRPDEDGESYSWLMIVATDEAGYWSSRVWNCWNAVLDMIKKNVHPLFVNTNTNN
jgi:hypothetical protein